MVPRDQRGSLLPRGPGLIVSGRLDFFSCVRRIAFRYVPNAATRLSRSKTMVEGVQRITSSSAAYA